MSEPFAVYKAIAACMADLAKEGISKDRSNAQQGYKFRGIDDVYDALAPILSKHGLCFLPRILSRGCEERQTAKGGTLFYVTVEAEFDLVCAEDGSRHTVRTFGEAMDSADKATNKAMSAAYKYAAFQSFCIPCEGEDADATTHSVKPKQQPPQGVPNRPSQPSAPQTQGQPSPDQQKYFPRVKAALDALFGDDTEAKKIKIKELTTFTGKDDKQVPGIEDYRKLDGKRLMILSSNLEKLAPPKPSAAEVCGKCGKTLDQGVCWNIDCEDGRA